MNLHSPLHQFYHKKKILLTGHTGFKGSWLLLWLTELGADVVGYSLPPPTQPNHFELARLKDKVVHIEGDIRNFENLLKVFTTHQPEIVFHLAAQPIVLRSFSEPKETFDTNVLGTTNVLEAIRHTHSVKAAVMVTSDKCYENKEWIWGYREHDHLGGTDPYSASKAMAELAIASYRDSFFSTRSKRHCSLASVRAGNVIGGGDFSDFRLVPDTMKALLKKETILLRNPKSVRPWLHVLEPLHGYLQLATELTAQGHKYAEAWNFGPKEHCAISTQELVEHAISLWGDGSLVQSEEASSHKEMGLLRLNWDKAANHLGWTPRYNWKEAIHTTVDWFKAYQGAVNMQEFGLQQIHQYMKGQ